MSYGIDSRLTKPPAECVSIHSAAVTCHTPVEQIEEYVREGLIIPLKSENGIKYFTDVDYQWIETLQRLQLEAHLSCEAIRSLMLGRCGCWKFRHCEFHNTNECPMTTDPSRPCWVNRASWHILASYPCYSCLVYRTLPYCAGIGTVLQGSALE